MNENQINRLKFFPIMMFAIVMGLSGITIVYQKAHQLLSFPAFFGNLFLVIDTILFFLILVIYLTKLIRYPEVVKSEFLHPVRINFFAATSISFILLAIIYKEEFVNISKVFWYIGTVIQTFFTFYTLAFWINHNQEINHSNPAWFIPIVGNILIPVGGVGFVDNQILYFYFSIGLFFWIILTAILLNRIIFHHQMAAKFMPTLFILIAPPAVAIIAYVKMEGVVDFFAFTLYNIGLFFTLLLAFMYKNFIRMKFFISWWAFTFPLAAITIASMLIYSATNYSLYELFSYLFLTATTIILLIVVYHTIKNILKKEICKPE